MSPRRLYHLARADFLERTRRHAFLITVVFMVYAAYVFLPGQHSTYTTLQIAGHRGIYNSAYVGTLVAMMSTIFLTFAGFYVVKNTVDRDLTTGVGEILATTPITKAGYTVGKALSNAAVLAAMIGVVAIAAAGMQWVRAEDRHLDVLALVTPFVVLTLPVMMVVAALAVLFETVPLLRGGLGNVVFFVLWIGGISSSAVSSRSTHPSGVDLLGAGLVFPGIFDACNAAFHDFRPHTGAFSMGLNFKSSGTWDLTLFRWEGVRWTAGMIASRGVWVALAAAIATTAAIPFDRFDRARGAVASRRRTSTKRATVKRSGEAVEVDPDSATVAAPRAHPTLAAPAPRSFSFATMLGAELRLMLMGVRPAWIVVAIGLAVACALAPFTAARTTLLAVAWIWPLLFWSSMGAREARHQTGPLVFSSPHPLGRQLPAAWLAGVILAWVTGAGMGVRLAIMGDGPSLFGWAVGALFIPSFALACGVWTGGGKLFEVLYLLLWYGGPLQGVPYLDFTGGAPGARARHVPEAYGAATLALLALAWIGRRRRLRS